MKNAHCLGLPFFALSLLLVACAENGASGENSADAQAAAGTTRPLVLASGRIDLAPALLRAPETTRLVLRTPDGATLNLTRVSREQMAGEAIAWHGVVEGDPSSDATIVENQGALAGIIYSARGTYRLRSREDGVVMERIDRSRFLPEAEPTPRSGIGDETADRSADTCTTDTGATIDVMVVYTDDARAGAGGTAQMVAEVNLAITQANESYRKSNVRQRLRLVHTAEVNYAESHNTTTDRDRLKARSDGHLDNVHALRDSYGADSVMLIAESYTNAAGQSYIMTPVGNAFQDSAFGVVQRSYASGNISFAHELGHQMSARHDWGADSINNAPYAFNHGYQRPRPTAIVVLPWRTIMATACVDVICNRVPHWSNPNVLYPGAGGDPTGVATGAQRSDNAQVLNLTARTVANFRCSV